MKLCFQKADIILYYPYYIGMYSYVRAETPVYDDVHALTILSAPTVITNKTGLFFLSAFSLHVNTLITYSL